MYLYFYFINIGILIKYIFVDGIICIKVVMLGNINNFYSLYINIFLVKIMVLNLILKNNFYYVLLIFRYNCIWIN